MNWEEIIPFDLQTDFTRQVSEAVSAELMKKLLEADETGQSIDADELELRLTKETQARYIDAFRNGSWPPQSIQQVGVKQIDRVEQLNWICSNCRERNSNSFETCHKCSESRQEDSRTEAVSRPLVVLPRQNTSFSVPVSRASSGWTCKECGNENTGIGRECGKCQQDQDPYRRTTWPDYKEVAEAGARAEMRKKLFDRMREELDMDDPFSSVEISHEEFFRCLEKMKKELLEEARFITC